MDKGLILCVLLVTLSWKFLGTYAMTNTTTNSTSSSNSSTTATSNMTVTGNMTSHGNTSATPTGNMTAAGNMTNHGNMTTMPPGNMTTMTGNMTNPGNTSTTPTGNMNNTQAENTTVSTQAPPLVTNTSVAPLQGTITRNDCGTGKLCADRPTDCDPSTGDNCFFLSAKERSSQTFDFELSGQSDGYIAAGLSTAENQAGSHRAYICANNNGSVRFFTATIDNFELNTTASLDSSNERGSFASGKIQCTFTAELPDTSARAEASYSLSVSTGSFNASSLAFGRATFAILTSRVNLSDPSANITNLLTTNTTNASAHPVTATLSFLPALMVTICMLAFTAM
ncbi:PREDICTED: putative ferric-chelate reductase 1 isoform X2 [Cyprinodon variegatus]|uniref:putative ferric-chelate reductase 1 isoform X2 n=1 Tax=Cyprinodon variegatus TaxID=28743 RepID=UPI000742A264|nr:PREDICTED: putative ferric-chelate reductase 1 isoform X2 [Cyprinodon variegatus]XP_015256785.1 PREDICTED: putative ferric-chelate reductase 1 isoform X2 [Cyprinodon variegatus]